MKRYNTKHDIQDWRTLKVFHIRTVCATYVNPGFTLLRILYRGQFIYTDRLTVTIQWRNCA